MVAGVGASGQKSLNRSGVPPSRGGEFHVIHHMGTLPPHPKQTLSRKLRVQAVEYIGFVIKFYSVPRLKSCTVCDENLHWKNVDGNRFLVTSLLHYVVTQIWSHFLDWMLLLEINKLPHY